MFEIEYQVKESDIGQPYNHVHHATCLRFMEHGRLEFLKSVGFPNEEFLAQGLFLVITDIAVQYKREVRQGPIKITCDNPRIEKRTVVVDQRILNPRGKVAVEATVKSMFLSNEKRRATHPPEEFVQAFR